MRAIEDQEINPFMKMDKPLQDLIVKRIKICFFVTAKKLYGKLLDDSQILDIILNKWQSK